VVDGGHWQWPSGTVAWRVGGWQPGGPTDQRPSVPAGLRPKGGWWLCWGGGLPDLSVYGDVEKTSTG
jgi:hypothetical protein